MFCNDNQRGIEVALQFLGTPSIIEESSLPKLEEVIIKVPRSSNTFTIGLRLSNGLLDTFSPGGIDGTLLKQGSTPVTDLSNMFEACRCLMRSLYLPPFRNAVNLGANVNYFDMSVGQAFILDWNQLKAGTSKKQNEAADRLSDDIRRIFGFKRLEINTSADGTTLKVLIDGKSYALAELGSGMTQFLLVLAEAAKRQPSYILIDEPELNLHPSLQLDFLTTLSSCAQEGVLFATHSIGLARAGADLVYSVRKNDQGESEITELESTPRLSEFLGELSFSGYKELGFNKILLVEGSTDVKTLQQFLRKLGLDHQIVILPLGGSQLINESAESQLEEIKRISENIYALIDSERSAKDEELSPVRKAFVEVCERTQIFCHVLERRATENYLSNRAIKRVKGEKYRALAPYEVLRNINPAWGKEENWRIGREMELTELEGTIWGVFAKIERVECRIDFCDVNLRNANLALRCLLCRVCKMKTCECQSLEPVRSGSFGRCRLASVATEIFHHLSVHLLDLSQISAGQYLNSPARPLRETRDPALK